MNNHRKGLTSKIESFYERYPGENFGFAAVALIILTVGISIFLYMQVDPTFNFFTHYVSGLGGPPKGAPEGIHYLSATVYNLGMLLAVPLRIAFLFQVIILVKKKGAGIWLSRTSLMTGLVSSTGWLLMALVPFSANLDLHMIGALVYFLGATSFQFIFALTELKTLGLPKHLPFLGLLNLVVFSVFSYQLIQVEVLQIPGIPEPAIYEWLVFASAILWVLAHGMYSLKARKSARVSLPFMEKCVNEA
jgi:hypothetical membrane protein